MSHWEADVQIVPILRLTDGANSWEIPLQVVSQFGLSDHFVAIEVAADVVPLTTTINDLPAIVELQRSLHTGGVAYLVNQLLAEYQWLVVELIGRLRPVSRQEAIKVALAGHFFEQRLHLWVFRLRQLKASGLPVTPAIGRGQILWEFFG